MHKSRSPLTIHLFGPLRVLIDAQPMPRVRTRSIEWLLALLVLRHERSVDRSWLAGTLWPDTEESKALHNLRDALVHLRKALGPERERLQSPTRDTLTFDLEGAEVDLVAFDAAIRAGNEASLQQAAALYTGSLLEGCYEEWVSQERESRTQACLAALARLAAGAEKRQDYPEALRLLRRAEGMDALSDTIQRALMRVLSASGDAPAALFAYRDYRLRLREEMNVEPDVETVRLYQQIRAGKYEGKGKREQGKEEDRSQKSEVRRDSSFILHPSSFPSALPHPLTSLLGREQEMREIAEALSRSRLVTLVGAGGVGKTRLAIQVARESASNIADGIAFVALASLSDAALLPAFVASALGVREEANPVPAFLLQSLVNWLSMHEVLLVLDNCEHLIEAAADLTRTLLECCPDLRVLATSRQRLGLTGEIVRRVPSLPSPDPKAFRLLENNEPIENLPESLQNQQSKIENQLMQYPAVQLFVERAGMARADFRLAGIEDGLAIARICHRLDGIPLAIELAAARVGLLSASQIASRLDDRFRLLTGGSRTALPRQQTLKSLIDWSYHLLTEEEQGLLCQLSVFAGGWTLEAAQAVCSGGVLEEWEVFDLLTSLMDQSLVVAETSGASRRYRLLETIRQYAQERLRERGEEQDAQDRHLIHFLALVEEAEPHLIASEQQRWLERLETEHDNLRAALQWALSDDSHRAAALRLCGAAARFWQIRGHFGEGRHWCDAALSSPVGVERNAQRAKAIAGAGLLAFWQGDPSAAGTLYEECLSIRREIGDKTSIAASLADLGTVEEVKGRFESARKLFEESLSIRRALGDRWGIAATLNDLAKTEAYIGTRLRAQELMEESLAMSRELNDMAGVARTLRTLGTLLVVQGDPFAARAALNESLEIQERLGDKWSTGYSLAILGIVGLEEGNTDIARSHFTQATAIFSDLHDNWGIALLLQQWASLAVAEAKALRAARLYGFAERLFEEVGSTMLLVLRGRYERDVVRARAALGDAAIFQAAFLEGRSFTKEQAIAYALAK